MSYFFWLEMLSFISFLAAARHCFGVFFGNEKLFTVNRMKLTLIRTHHARRLNLTLFSLGLRGKNSFIGFISPTDEQCSTNTPIVFYLGISL